jgi:hypothetical protein
MKSKVKPGLDITPDRNDLEVRAYEQQLRAAPGRAGANPRVGRQCLKRSMYGCDQGIGNIFALGHRRQDQIVRPLRRQIFKAVHRQLDGAITHRSLYLLGEKANPTNGRQRSGAIAVSLSFDVDQLDQ